MSSTLAQAAAAVCAVQTNSEEISDIGVMQLCLRKHQSDPYEKRERPLADSFSCVCRS